MDISNNQDPYKFFKNPDSPLSTFRIGFIGAGNMAQAIVTGMLDAGITTPEMIMVSAPSENNFAFWKSKGIQTTHNNAMVVSTCDIVMLAMKPQYLDDAISTLGAFISNNLYISILAGISIEVLNEKIRTHFRFSETGPEPWRIVRVIPNTPIMVGAGATAYAVRYPKIVGSVEYMNSNKTDSKMVKTIFSAAGLCEEVPERLMNAVGALSGSGPAYVYLMIEALCDGAVKMGIPRSLATQLACQTLAGATKMVQQSGKHPGQLKDEVCSPGGSTIAGMHVLEQSGVRAALISAVEAASHRSSELGNK